MGVSSQKHTLPCSSYHFPVPILHFPLQTPHPAPRSGGGIAEAHALLLGLGVEGSGTRLVPPTLLANVNPTFEITKSQIQNPNVESQRRNAKRRAGARLQLAEAHGVVL